MPIGQSIERIRQRPLYLWLCLWVAVALFFLPAWKAGYQEDFQGWLELYHDFPFWGMLNRDLPSVHSFYHLTQLQLYILTTLFGVHPIPWFLLFTGLHALNGAMLYRLCSAVMNDMRLASASRIAMIGTLLVLFNPSMTEVVVWKACYHYLVAVQALLWMLFWARQYLLSGDAKWVRRGIVLLILLSFTIELWYTIPVLVLIMAATYWRAQIISKERFHQALLRLFLPLFSIFVLHLIAYWLVYGIRLPHAAYTSAGDDSPFIIAGRFWSYQWHLLGFGRFFRADIRQIYYSHIGGYWGGMVAIALFVLLTIWVWLRFSRWPPAGHVAALLGAWGLVSLVIIIHFSPPDLLLAYNDRHIYLTALFQWMLIALIIVQAFRHHTVAGNVVAVTVLLVCLGFTGQLVMDWRRSGKVFWAMQNKFVWKDAPVVLVLNMPTNYNGIGVITGRDTSELPAHMRVYGKGAPRGRVIDVSSYNMQHPGDGAHVIVQDSTHLHVILNQWGAWWWLNKFGAVDRSNALFDLHFIDGAHDYMLTLKQRPPGIVILYQQGQEWRVVNMNKIGMEQW